MKVLSTQGSWRTPVKLHRRSQGTYGTLSTNLVRLRDTEIAEARDHLRADIGQVGGRPGLPSATRLGHAGFLVETS